jgi:hypothetical protein
MTKVVPRYVICATLVAQIDLHVLLVETSLYNMKWNILTLLSGSAVPRGFLLHLEPTSAFADAPCIVCIKPVNHITILDLRCIAIDQEIKEASALPLSVGNEHDGRLASRHFQRS